MISKSFIELGQVAIAAVTLPSLRLNSSCFRNCSKHQLADIPVRLVDVLVRSLISLFAR